MPLPYSYKSNFEIPNTENFDLQSITEHSYHYFKSNDLKNTEIKEDTVSFICNNAFIKFSFPVSFTFYKKENINIEYEFKLENLLKITIVLILLIAFFSSFSMSAFLWFSFIISVIFFGANVIFIDTNIKKIIKSLPVYSLSNPDIDEKLSEEQISWINDKTKCSACGEEINEYDYHCPECGLKLNNKIKTIPFDVTKYQNKRFKYHLKDKKENK